MKAAMRMCLGMVAVFAVLAMVRAADDKEKTLKGTICCSKCSLNETDECGNAIKVKEDGKEVVYYFIDKGRSEKYHKKVCTKPSMGTVKGVVSEKDGKKYITPSKDGVKYE